jgi:hypothetical protein
MFYEINVAKNGKHYFATAERSILHKDSAKEIVKHFKTVFPKSEGYSISCSLCMKTSKDVDFS